MTALRFMIIGLMLTLLACHRAAPPNSLAAAKVHQVPTSQPVVEMWNGGIYLLGVKPFLLFAAWEDGTVLRRAQPGPHRTPSEAPLQIAQAAPGAIDRLSNDLRHAGFFNPPIKGPILYADGPEYIILVRDHDQLGELRYHGGDPDLDRYGPDSTPSRAQMEAYYNLWRGTVTTIRSVRLADTAAYRGPEPTLAR